MSLSESNCEDVAVNNNIEAQDTNTSSSLTKIRTQNFLDYPHDILMIIFHEILICDGTFDLTMEVVATEDWKGVERFRGKLPELLVHYKGLQQANKYLQRESMLFLAQNNVFGSKFTGSIFMLPKTIGKSTFHYIEHFELNIDKRNKKDHEVKWPRLIAFVVEKLPNLTTLKLYTSYKWSTGGARGPEDESGKRVLALLEGEQRRVLLRLGAFINLRHPRLNTMLYPSDSTPSFVIERYQELDTPGNMVPLVRDYCVCMVVLKDSKFVIKRQSSTKYDTPWVKDEVTTLDEKLNATAIRRVMWDDLPYIPVSDFVIDWDTTSSSEVPEDHKFFEHVDQKGYSFRVSYKNRTVDKFLGRGYRDMERAEQAEQSAVTAQTPQEPSNRATNKSRGYRGRYRGKKSKKTSGRDVNDS